MFDFQSSFPSAGSGGDGGQTAGSDPALPHLHVRVYHATTTVSI